MEIPIETIKKYQRKEKPSAGVNFDENYFSRFSVSVPNPIIFDERVSSTAVRIYGLLQIFAMWKDRCYPGHEKLAAALKISSRQIRTCLKNLEKTDWIKIQRRGLGKTNLYIISWPENCYSPDKARAQKQAKKDKAANAWKVR